MLASDWIAALNAEGSGADFTDHRVGDPVAITKSGCTGVIRYVGMTKVRLASTVSDCAATPAPPARPPATLCAAPPA